MSGLPKTRHDLTLWLHQRQKERPDAADWLGQLIAALQPGSEGSPPSAGPDYDALFARYRSERHLSIAGLSAEVGITPWLLRKEFTSRYGDLFFAAASSSRRGRRAAHDTFPLRRPPTDWTAMWQRYRDTPGLSLSALAKETDLTVGQVLYRLRRVVTEEEYASAQAARNLTNNASRVARITRFQAIYQEWLDLGRPTLEAMGSHLGITRERVRQILSRNPKYKADLAEGHAVRNGQTFSWRDGLWEVFRDRPAEYEAERQRAEVPAALARRVFAYHWPDQFPAASKREHDVRVQQRRLNRALNDAALMEAWRQYQTDPAVTFQVMGRQLGMAAITVHRKLALAFGAAFWDVTRKRRGWNHPLHPMHHRMPQ